MKSSFFQRASGQGALEYLLLIGGAVLVATIILIMVLGGAFPTAGSILNSNLDAYRNISIGTIGGGGGAFCGDNQIDPGEFCDGDGQPPCLLGEQCINSCTQCSGL